MAKKKTRILEDILVEKLVHGGQALATAPDGKKLFLWNALPGEKVHVTLTKIRKDHAEGYAHAVIEQSEHRRASHTPDDLSYSVTPWDIMSYTHELSAKQTIAAEAFEREDVPLDVPEVKTVGSLHQYRNKVEFSFWGDDDGVHYAHYIRGTHRKIKLKYPYHPLIPDQMAAHARHVLWEINEQGVRAGDLKSVIMRCDDKNPAESKVASALFVKDKDVPKLITPSIVVYSDPKSPVSVRSKDLQQNDDYMLTDTIYDIPLMYSVFSFFQLNIPVFEAALADIEHWTADMPTIDMYSGVGAIGLTVGASKLIESDADNVEMAQKNSADKDVEVIHAEAEKALEHIDGEHCIIVDPPRAGLHKNVIERILEVLPPRIIYLSCNPSTQARDVGVLAERYSVAHAQAFNFFPRTPHIENLIVLEKR